MSALLVLTAGRFGAAVGRILAVQAPSCRVTTLAESLAGGFAGVQDADFVALAAWRLHDRESRALDEACWAAGVSWSSAYLSNGELFCGVRVTPGRGPCYPCFRRRFLTHQRAPERDLCVTRAYDRDPELGPEGFAPPTAWMAAAALFEDARATGEPGGRLRRVDLFTGEVVDTRVVAVHACPRCREDVAAERGGRFVRHLSPAVEEILR
jgi:hypothetical protein